jgi:signal transduction histidine kinase
MIEEAGKRGSELIRRLLAFARKQPLRPVAVDVNSLVMEAAKLLRSTLGEHIEIQMNLADDSCALIDPSQLTSAILNLGLNARDAMPDGGKLVIETSNVVLDDSTSTDGNVSVGDAVIAGNYVMIAVTDTGNGIPAGILTNVFEPVFTTKEVDKGTGLGLSMGGRGSADRIGQGRRNLIASLGATDQPTNRARRSRSRLAAICFNVSRSRVRSTGLEKGG